MLMSVHLITSHNNIYLDTENTLSNEASIILWKNHAE
ncbi:MAG: hypothetical protein ACI9T7_001667 [Oleiphilaceae bacterium]